MRRLPFVCGVDEATLTSFVYSLTKSCQECGCAMICICLEECCSTKPIYCIECQSDTHFLHRLNDLRMLFVDSTFTTCAQALQKDRLEALIAEIEKQRQLSEEIVSIHKALVGLYEQNIREARGKLDLLNSNKWYAETYKVMEKLIRKEVRQSEARHLYRQLLSKFNVHAFSKMPINSLKQTKQQLELSQTVLSQAAESLRSILLLDSANTSVKPTIERVLAATSYDSFFKESHDGLHVVSSIDRSRTVRAQQLGTRSIVAKRIKIVGTPNDAKVKQLDLDVIFPVVEEMYLSFRPRKLPSKLKKLSIVVPEKVTTADSFDGLFPQDLRFLRVQADQISSRGLSEPLALELSRLGSLWALEIDFSLYNWKSVKALTKFALENNLRWLSYSERKLDWNVEYAQRYDIKVKEIRHDHRKTVARIILMHRMEPLRKMCTAFRQSILEQHFPQQQSAEI